MIKLYVVKDVETEMMQGPCFFINDVLAMRQFYLSLEKIPDTVRSCLNLVQVAVFDDNFVLQDNAAREIALGKDFDSWMEIHKNKE